MPLSVFLFGRVLISTLSEHVCFMPKHRKQNCSHMKSEIKEYLMTQTPRARWGENLLRLGNRPVRPSWLPQVLRKQNWEIWEGSKDKETGYQNRAGSQYQKVQGLGRHKKCQADYSWRIIKELVKSGAWHLHVRAPAEVTGNQLWCSPRGRDVAKSADT